MIRIGIDSGGTNTQGVLIKDGRVLSKKTIYKNRPEDALQCFQDLIIDTGIKKSDIGCLCVTGGLSKKFPKDLFEIDFVNIKEIDALGKGGEFLTGKKDIFIVCAGTGTSFVSVKSGIPEHVGGTGIGGGTLKGLSNLILDSTVEEAEGLARSGKNYNIDMTVRDIIGEDLCKIPADATASNFGKAAKEHKREDVASAIMNMVSETIGVMAYFAARTCGLEKNIVICGRVTMNEIIKKRLLHTIELFGGKALIPENSSYCGAIGSALLFRNKS